MTRMSEFASQAASPPSEEPVNWPEALRSLQGNRTLLRAVVQAALEEIPRLMSEVRQAVAQRDRTKLRLSAHTLKGSLRYLGAARVFEEAYRLETMGRDGLLDDASQAVENLDTDMKKVTAILAEHLQHGFGDTLPREGEP